MKVIGIYKITNTLSNKIYIGQTTNYKKRKRTHLSRLKNKTHHNKHLQKAFDKYGVENFRIDLICECEECELDTLEIRYIKSHDCTNQDRGYNMMYGGQKYRTFTPEVKEKMSKALKGRKFTEEHKRKISASNKGKTMSKDAVEKMRRTKISAKKHIGEKNPNALISNSVAKKIIIDLIDGQTVKDISKKHNASADTVYNLMYNRSYQDIMPEVRKSLKNRTSIIGKDKIDTAVKMYLNGTSQNKISKELNISRNTLRREFQKRNIDTQLHTNQYIIKQTNTEVSD